MPTVRQSVCAYCGGCVSLCPSGALELAETRLLIDEELCTECGQCVTGCPTGALSWETESLADESRRCCDLVVVGAGPAGATTARYAAERGLEVLLLEKRQEIGSAVRCAEGIN